MFAYGIVYFAFGCLTDTCAAALRLPFMDGVVARITRRTEGNFAEEHRRCHVHFKGDHLYIFMIV